MRLPCIQHKHIRAAERLACRMFLLSPLLPSSSLSSSSSSSVESQVHFRSMLTWWAASIAPRTFQSPRLHYDKILLSPSFPILSRVEFSVNTYATRALSVWKLRANYFLETNIHHQEQQENPRLCNITSLANPNYPNPDYANHNQEQGYTYVRV